MVRTPAEGAALLGKVPLRYKLRNLAVRWRTTAVIALAFTLIVTPLTIMLGFVNAMGHDFRIAGISAARDAGYNLSAQGITLDREGLARPASS